MKTRQHSRLLANTIEQVRHTKTRWAIDGKDIALLDHLPQLILKRSETWDAVVRPCMRKNEKYARIAPRPQLDQPQPLRQARLDDVLSPITYQEVERPRRKQGLLSWPIAVLPAKVPDVDPALCSADIDFPEPHFSAPRRFRGLNEPVVLQPAP